MKKFIISLFFLVSSFLLIGCIFQEESPTTDGAIDNSANDFEDNTLSEENDKPYTDEVIFSSVEDFAYVLDSCTSTESHIDDLDFSFHSFECDNNEHYRDLGNHLLSVINANGLIFFDDDHFKEWDDDLGFQFTEEEELLVVYYKDENQIIDSETFTTAIPLQEIQNDTELHMDFFNKFVRLIPKEYRMDIVEFIIFAHDETTGYVEQYIYDDDETTKWAFSLNAVDIESNTERISTIIHEFAHIFTLGEDQVTPYVSENQCDQLFLIEGCSKPDSYIQHFYDEFWADITAQGIAEDEDLLFDYYLDHQDHFVNDYAATSLDEDIAETFTYFILEPTPEGNFIKDEKILFFYEYPEVVKLRTRILLKLESMIVNDDLW